MSVSKSPPNKKNKDDMEKEVDKNAIVVESTIVDNDNDNDGEHLDHRSISPSTDWPTKTSADLSSMLSYIPDILEAPKKDNVNDIMALDNDDNKEEPKEHDCQTVISSNKQYMVHFRENLVNKNVTIENLSKEKDKVADENRFLKTVLKAMKNPKLVEDILDENIALKSKIINMESTLYIRKNKIKSLMEPSNTNDYPEHIWASHINKDMAEKIKALRNELITYRNKDNVSNMDIEVLSNSPDIDSEKDAEKDRNKDNVSNMDVVVLSNSPDIDFEQIFDDGDFTCKLCPFQTNNMTNLKNHEKNAQHMTKGDNIEYICEECGTECSTEIELNIHNTKHITEHICSHCGSGLSSMNDLKRHIINIHKIYI